MSVRGRIGHLLLQRDATLNALTIDMVRSLSHGLEAHLHDPRVHAILIRSSSERAFCAGGDMKRVREWVLAARLDRIDAFFEAEYALNLAIARATKPYIAILDGVAMGGGLGISVHGSHRVVSERARLAMPETRIGLFPDVGGTHFLPRLPQSAGRWLALTAQTLVGDEAVTVGLATHAVEHARLGDLVHALEHDRRPVEAVIDEAAHPPADGEMQHRMARREPWFQPTALEDIRDALKGAADHDADAASLLEALDGASPYALATTLDLFDGSESRDLEVSLTREFAAVRQAVRHPDFAEGVRAVLVDKDRTPRWASTGRDD